MTSISAAKALGSTTHQYPGKLLVTETFFLVPKDYSKPNAEVLKIFVRSTERFTRPVKQQKPSSDDNQPLFLYLQGGPGFGCRSPASTSWINIILEKGYKVILMDQRGTGLSSPVNSRALSDLGGPQQQAQHLTHFRADSIVNDCEAIRLALTDKSDRKWSILGQSFGGFCAVHYLSKYPEALQEVFITGGLPPLFKAGLLVGDSETPEEIYRKLFADAEKVRERNHVYYRRFPEDVDRVKEIVRHLQNHTVLLPDGGKMTVTRFRQLGLSFGFHGSFESVHELILRLHCDLVDMGYLSRQSLSSFESWQPFDDAPLYALIHEAIYAEETATRWSADRVLRSLPDFMQTCPDSEDPVLFVGEMVLRDMFHDYTELRPLGGTADLLASIESWPKLYDEDRLAHNEVEVYAAIYIEDMYVHYDFAKETAGKIKNCRTFITNVLYHNAIGARSSDVLSHLFNLRDDLSD